MSKQVSRKRKPEDDFEEGKEKKRPKLEAESASSTKRNWGKVWKTLPNNMEPMQQWILNNFEEEKITAMRQLKSLDEGNDFGGWTDKIGDIHWYQYVLSIPKEDRVLMLLLIVVGELAVGQLIQYDHTEVYFRKIMEDNLNDLIVPNRTAMLTMDADFCINSFYHWIPTNQEVFSKPVISIGECLFPPTNIRMIKFYLGFDVLKETAVLALWEHDAAIEILEWNLEQIVQFIRDGQFQGRDLELINKIPFQGLPGIHAVKFYPEMEQKELFPQWIRIVLMEFLFNAKPPNCSVNVKQIETETSKRGYKMENIELFWSGTLEDMID